jgi:hypothetical protein
VISRAFVPHRVVVLAVGISIAVSGCATGEMRAINRVASANTAALKSADAAYEAALSARADLGARGPFLSRELVPVITSDLAQGDRDFVRYATNVATLRRHAALLSTYFSVITEYTAPGEKSATKLTDAQLSGAAGLIGALNDAVPALADVSSGTTTVVLNEMSAGSLRDHLQEYGPTIADALLVQQEAMEAAGAETANARDRSCDNGLQLFQNANSAADPGRAVALADTAGFIEKHRAALTCTRGSAEAQRAAAELAAARASFLTIIEQSGASGTVKDAARHQVDEIIHRPLPAGTSTSSTQAGGANGSGGN